MPSPNSRVRLKHAAPPLPLPGLGGHRNGCSKATLHIPASRKIAALALGSEILTWISLFCGMGLGGWLLAFRSSFSLIAPASLLLGSLLAALAFHFLRNFVLRRVRVRKATNGSAELLFQSESYAKEFSQRNHLPLATIAE